jgi:hypothetical protein
MRLGTLLVVCGVALAGCDTGPASPTQASCTFTLSATSVTIGAAGGPGSIAVSTASHCTWAARTDAAWISATGGTSATGPGTFSFTVAAASGTAARTGTLTVAGQPVLVTQQGEACAFALLPPSRSFDALGGTAAFDVNAPPACAWTSAATAPWLTLVSGQSGTGNGTVAYAVAPNAGARRAAAIARSTSTRRARTWHSAARSAPWGRAGVCGARSQPPRGSRRSRRCRETARTA